MIYNGITNAQGEELLMWLIGFIVFCLILVGLNAYFNATDEDYRNQRDEW